MDIAGKNGLQTPFGIAVAAAMGVGTVTHLFGLVNILHNYDDIAQQPSGYGTGISSGRWLLSQLGDCAHWLGGNYNLPLVNGLLFLLLIAISAGFLVAAFDIQNRAMAGLSGALLAVFPAAFSTLVFRYTSAYYGLGILLAVFAAWVLPRHRFGVLLSAICIAGSLGIYQAYVPFTIGIFVLQLLQQTLKGQSSLRMLVCRGIYFCMVLLLGLVCYYLFLKLALWIYGTSLSDYQGVDQMGRLAVKDIPGLLKEAYYIFCTFPVKNHYGLASMKLIKAAYIVLAGVSAAILGYILLIRKNIGLTIFSVLLCLLFPLAVNFVEIMCPESWIYTLMVYPFVLTGITPAVLLTCLPECGRKYGRNAETVIVLVLAVLVGGYAYKTNVNYSALYFSNRQIENYLSSLIVQIRMTEGFDTEKEWAFVGEMEDPLLNSYWQYEMEFGGIEPTQGMLQRYSWGEWVRNYYGYTFPVADNAAILRLSEMEAVKQMPYWPDQGSVQVIDNYVVIKCADPYRSNPN